MKPNMTVFTLLIPLAWICVACGSSGGLLPTPIPPTETLTVTPSPTPVLSLEELAGRVCDYEGFPSAAEYGKSLGQAHKVFLVDENGKEHPWNQAIPAQDRAQSVSELEAVVCVDEQVYDLMNLYSCGKYSVTQGMPTINISTGSMARDVHVFAARTGKLLHSLRVRGVEPNCPETVSSSQLHENVLYGPPVEFTELWSAIQGNIINATATPTPTPTPTATPAPTLRALYPDGIVSSWDVDVDEDFSADSFYDLLPGQSLVDGMLRWEVHSKEPLFAQQIHRWSSINDNTDVRVVARYNGERESDAYGLLFHSQDENTYLAFLIRDDGTFDLRNGSSRLIDHQPSKAIHPGDWNELEALWLDKGIYLYINGVQVAYLELLDPYYGQAGLTIDLSVDSIYDDNSTFEFDELEIREPK
jgi:hypothetical protein